MKITYEQMKAINDLALMKMEEFEPEYKNSIKTALKLLKKNSKDYPCWITFNNLAWFYYEWWHGIQIPYRIAKIIESNAKRALQDKWNLTSLRVLSELYYKKQWKKKFIEIQIEILKLSNDLDDIYLMGLAHFMNEEYRSALPYLDQANVLNKIGGDFTIYHTYSADISYIACLAMAGHEDEANNLALELFHTWFGSDTFQYDRLIADERLEWFGTVDVLHLMEIFYLIGNYKMIYNNYFEILKAFALNPSIFSMIAYSCKQCCPEENFIRISEQLLHDEEERNRIDHWRYRAKQNQRELASNFEDIKAGIKPKLIYWPDWVYRCHFIGSYFEYNNPYPD